MPVDDTSAPLDSLVVTRVQLTVRALLYYAHTVDNKPLVVLSASESHQATATTPTNGAVSQLSDYIATHPDNGVVYCTSGMHIAAIQMLNSTMNHKGAAETTPTSFFLRMMIAHAGMARFAH